MTIRVGTSGFSYQDWKGTFYPEGLPDRDMLSYYAKHFSTVEINSTFYRVPGPETFVRMQKKVPADFCFVVKASKALTHEVSEESEEVFRRFCEALKPLLDAGQLGCVLAQFPWSFRNLPANRAYLQQLPDRLQGIPTVVELRNRDWVAPESFALLRDAGLGFCCVDEPRLEGLMPPLAVATSPIGYVRFHGRNAQKWWQHEAAWERYDYLYSEEELREWVAPIGELARQTETTFVFFNNHYQGKAGRNAQMLRELLLPVFP
ncbi:MAG: DUF72 domain-containing protein [Armatimonadota bacterium]|nr:DUF72 domain-containing protein [Armatimonadota bacterium]